MPAVRSSHNPLLIPDDIVPTRPDFEVTCVINAGVARLGEEVILLLRVVERPRRMDDKIYLAPVFDPEQRQLQLKEFPRGQPGYDFSDPRLIFTPQGLYLTAISHLRVARSRDGINFTVDEQPALFPDNEYEVYGLEDPRISQVGDTFYIHYVAVSPLGIVTGLASTLDFHTFERLGVIFPPDNKDVAIFPERVNGLYYALHRPSTSAFGRPEIWLADSPDLLRWGNHRHLVGLRSNGWEDGRMGAGAVPVRIPQGWLEIYHAASRENRYCLAGLLLDADRPWQVIARSRQPILEPAAIYETHGFFGNVVFSCGALVEDGLARIYYGAADTCIAYAEMQVSEILAGME